MAGAPARAGGEAVTRDRLPCGEPRRPRDPLEESRFGQLVIAFVVLVLIAVVFFTGRG